MVRVELARGNRREVGWCTRLAGEGWRNGGDICGTCGEGERGRNRKVPGVGTSMMVGRFKGDVSGRVGRSTELE